MSHINVVQFFFVFFSSRRRHTRSLRDWSSDVCSSDLAADEAMSFGGGTQFSEGREAIGAGFDGFPAGAVLSWWPLGAEIAQSGDLGCSVGEATIESLHHYSKYLTVWKRQQDGGWKFVADGGNQRPAP